MKILVICGAGALGKYVVNEILPNTIGEYEAVYFFDNNKSLTGTSVLGITVISEENLIKIAEKNALDIIIATDYWQEIFNQCVKLHIEERVIEVVTKRTLLDYRYYNKSLSQDGEDLFLKAYFADKYNGFFVDIGAHHPIRFSNTAWAYKRGWRGINIEPNGDAIEVFNKYRKNDTNMQVGCGKEEGFFEYYKYEEPALNCFDKSVYPKLTPIATELIEIKTLKTILEENNVTNIDLLTIDVEGLEYEILESNDWKRWNPKVIVIEQFVESVEKVLESKIYHFLREKGYNLAVRTRLNSIFVL